MFRHILLASIHENEAGVIDMPNEFWWGLFWTVVTTAISVGLILYQNRITTAFDKWIEKRSLDTKNKTGIALVTEWSRVKHFHNDRGDFYLWIIGQGIAVAALSTVLVAFTLTSVLLDLWFKDMGVESVIPLAVYQLYLRLYVVLASGFYCVTAVWMFSIFFRILTRISRVRNFLDYQRATFKRMKALNLPDFAKEDDTQTTA